VPAPGAGRTADGVTDGGAIIQRSPTVFWYYPGK